MAPTLRGCAWPFATAKAALRQGVLCMPQPCAMLANFLARAAFSSSPRYISCRISGGILPHWGHNNNTSSNSSTCSSNSSSMYTHAVGSSTCKCVHAIGRSRSDTTLYAATTIRSNTWRFCSREDEGLRQCEDRTDISDLHASSETASCRNAAPAAPAASLPPPFISSSHNRSSTAGSYWRPFSILSRWCNSGSSSRQQCSRDVSSICRAECSGLSSGRSSGSRSSRSLSAFYVNESLSGGACCLADGAFVGGGSSSSRRFYAGGSSYWGEKMRGKHYNEETIEEWKKTFPHLRQYDNESLRAWRSVFDAMDRDYDGYLSQADLQKTPDFTLAKAQKLRDYDADQNNLIDFGEFVKALYNVDKEMFLDSFEGFDPVDIQLEFDKYSVVDEACPTKKHIPESRVELIMQHHKFTCITAPDVKRLFQEMDINGDGVIDFADFQQVSIFPAACALSLWQETQ